MRAYCLVFLLHGAWGRRDPRVNLRPRGRRRLRGRRDRRWVPVIVIGGGTAAGSAVVQGGAVAQGGAVIQGGAVEGFVDPGGQRGGYRGPLLGGSRVPRPAPSPPPFPRLPPLP